MKEVGCRASGRSRATASLRACLATILERSLAQVPEPGVDEDPTAGGTVSRWLGESGLGIVPIAAPASFAWPGPWIARVREHGGHGHRYVVMYGVPSGVVWDPAGGPALEDAPIDAGFLLAASDIALALPARPGAPDAPGTIEAIWLAASAGEPARSLPTAVALAGRGLDGDRHAVGAGTFPSGLPGSALTLIQAEVCESFEPPLGPDEHRRNVITRGIELGRLVGREFTIGSVRCRGARLCEPCTVIRGYASRPVLRELVHRGGLRADILDTGTIAVGDEIAVRAAGYHAAGRLAPG